MKFIVFRFSYRSTDIVSFLVFLCLRTLLLLFSSLVTCRIIGIMVCYVLIEYAPQVFDKISQRIFTQVLNVYLNQFCLNLLNLDCMKL